MSIKTITQTMRSTTIPTVDMMIIMVTSLSVDDVACIDVFKGSLVDDCGGRPSEVMVGVVRRVALNDNCKVRMSGEEACVLIENEVGVEIGVKMLVKVWLGLGVGPVTLRVCAVEDVIYSKVDDCEREVRDGDGIGTVLCMEVGEVCRGIEGVW